MQPTETPNSPTQNSPAQIVTTKPAKSKIYVLTIVMMVLVVGLAAGLGLVVKQQSDTKTSAKNQAAQVQKIEERTNALETAGQFTEKQVDESKYQAVFIAGGQVYFGKITEINKDTMKLEDIYYLKNGNFDKNGTVSGADISLVKLGKELHAPEDKMFIERKNLLFWENLQNDGQVSKAILAYKKSNL